MKHRQEIKVYYITKQKYQQGKISLIIPVQAVLLGLGKNVQQHHSVTHDFVSMCDKNFFQKTGALPAALGLPTQSSKVMTQN